MSSSRKRKAPDASPPATWSRSLVVPSPDAAGLAGIEQPLVRATQEGLREMQYRVSSVVDEMMKQKLAGKSVSSRRRSGDDGGAASQQDPETAAYLQAFQAAVADKVQALCQAQDPRESPEEDELVSEIYQFSHDLKIARDRLYATRARVARLSAATCSDSLRVSEAADNRASAILEARTAHARRESEAGGPLPLRIADSDDSSDGSGSDDNPEKPDRNRMGAFPGVNTRVTEPLLGVLFQKLSELPGPLKSVLQEIPELTASLALSVQEAEAAMEQGQSQTEALLGKAPPTPLPNRKGKRGGRAAGAAARGNGADGERQPPEDLRSSAREARVEQARKEWQSAGVGVVGGFFN